MYHRRTTHEREINAVEGICVYLGMGSRFVVYLIGVFMAFRRSSYLCVTIMRVYPRCCWPEN